MASVPVSELSAVAQAKLAEILEQIQKLAVARGEIYKLIAEFDDLPDRQGRGEIDYPEFGIEHYGGMKYVPQHIEDIWYASDQDC